MNIIDGHIHIGKWGEVFFNYESTVSQAVEVMKKAGVSSAVCMPADKEPNEKLLNECINRKDFKFYFTAWINPDDDRLYDFLKKNKSNISFLKFHPSFQKRRITDKSYEKYLAFAEDNNKPIIVHCGRWKEIAHFEYPLELSDKFNKLKIILAHLGGDQPGLYLECARKIKKNKLNNIYLGTESVREFYFVNEVVKTVGPDKIIFGSDYNLGLPDMYFPIIENLNISNNEKEMIFSGNILRLLGE